MEGLGIVMHLRRYRVTDYAEVDELAETLQSRTHTLCSGFRWNGLLLLNDATSEDGAQEYAVVREATSLQIESLTCSWYETPSKLADTLRALADGTHWAPDTEEAFAKHVPLHLDHADTPCRYCA